jgi:S-DNA-T family DNA segregation ATPase FtsK/SpoIIIE
MKAGKLAAGAVLAASGAWVVLCLAILGGATGEVVSGLLGLGGWVLAVLVLWAGVTVLRGRRYGAVRGLLDAILVTLCAALAHLASDGAGGAIGSAVGEAGVSGFGQAWAAVVFSALALLCLAERLTKLHAAATFARRSLEKAREAATSAAFEAPEAPVELGVAPARSQDDVAAEPEEPARDTVPAPAPKAERPRGKKSLVGSFELPGAALFSPSPAGGGSDERQLWQEAEALEAALAAYDVRGKVAAVQAGPVVSTFEVTLPAGTKFSKVAGLSGDLGMQLGRKVRVCAGSKPGLVALEVQNERRAAVGIRELLADDGFEAAKRTMSLPVAIGRDVRGHAVFCDLAAMPHMIVAGSTGSGKSVAVNSMLSSLLAARTPEELRLVLVDPKVVELMPYSGVPHLLAPPVSDVAAASRALAWCVAEMERRYALLAGAGSKNIQSYNAKAKADKLPFIVVVVDELADLMVQDKKAIEPLLVRLGQKARAAGIHVVAATQRPSVDVVTGLIKSNFPARLAFRVAQAVDSRVVLDETGAETLLGKGDALLKEGGADDAVRVQCPWVSEEDVERLAAHWKAQGPTRYDASVLDGEEAGGKHNKKEKKEGVVWS